MDRKVLAAITLSSLILACGTKSKTEAEGAEGAILSNAAPVLGTWTLSDGSRKSDGAKIATSGSQTLSLRANGTYFLSFESYSSSFGGVSVASGCTEYISGEYIVTNGNIQFSNRQAGVISGDCFGNKAGSLVPLTDEAKQIVVSNENSIQLVSPVSYSDLLGRPQVDYAISTYTRTEKETWGGSGLDPRFQGSFKLKTFIGTSTCSKYVGDPNSSKTGQYNILGTVNLDVSSDLRFKYVEENFSFGSGTPCTGETVGLLDISKNLEINDKAESWTSQCMAPEDENSDSKVELLSRDVFGPQNKWVMMSKSRSVDSTCAEGYSEWSTITVFQK